MAARAKRPPVTSAIRALRTAGVEFTTHIFEYERYPGAAGAAEALGVSAHEVIKTLVMESDSRDPMLVLMHGDLEVSTKALARAVGVKSIAPTTPKQARRVTGYQVGGISPFGVESELPIYTNRTVFDLDRLYINAGKRGFLVGMPTSDVLRLIEPVMLDIAG